MISRVKELRKNDLNMKQRDFANAIGITQQAYSLIEVGKRKLSDKHIKVICAVFNVSELRIRTGKGPKFYNSQQEAELVSVFSWLLPQNQQLLIDMANKLLSIQKEIIVDK